MTGIWGFILQTLYVSLVGGLLLLVKSILRDKLTPRWQYGVWSVLGLRILVPVGVSWKYVLLPLPLWVETARILAEQAIPVLWFTWLYWLYLAGVAVFLLRYLVSYIRLRMLLRRGEATPEGLTAQVKRVAEQYGLKPCQAVVLSGLPSPMVCGVLRPVLAVPDVVTLDDHVILHELLHVKYYDALQNVFWSICRALHWCNPIVHWFMDQIGNDMESLCDQRVLERLEGEERRDYGLSLLAMANDKYPRAPGTTSISNGGKNITRRIEAIVRFKKYPKGMALASVCVTVMLLCGCMFPTIQPELTYRANVDGGPLNNAAALAELNLNRCSTPAGAFDTYAKGLKHCDQQWLALASPEVKKQEILKGANAYIGIENGIRHWKNETETGVGLTVYEVRDREVIPTGAKTDIWLSQSSYELYNLVLQEDGSYTALLTFFFDNVQTLDGDLLCCAPTADEICAVATYPVRVWQETGWVLEETGNPSLYLLNNLDVDTFLYDLFPALHFYRGDGNTGSVFYRLWTDCSIEDPDGYWEEAVSFSTQYPCPDAEFGMYVENEAIHYSFSGSEGEQNNIYQAGMQVSKLNEDGTVPTFEELPGVKAQTEASGHGGGVSWISWRNQNWNGTLFSGGGGSTTFEEITFPLGYAAQIWLNDELAETIILKEVPPNG
ncbi:MAG: M56 family metallopeptidase [Ruminiclostridium sp.]|nr:M56 family metallopeptidase [Ruminiclostridium sp.]